MLRSLVGSEMCIRDRYGDSNMEAGIVLVAGSASLFVLSLYPSALWRASTMISLVMAAVSLFLLPAHLQLATPNSVLSRNSSSAHGAVEPLRRSQNGSCVNLKPDCDERVLDGECEIVDLHKMEIEHHQSLAQTLLECPASCGTCHMFSSKPAGPVLEPLGANGRPIACMDGHADCRIWAEQGECSANPSYMITSCAKSCHTCHMLDYTLRCRRLPEHQTPALVPGDVDKMFRRLAAAQKDKISPFYKYKVKVLARPPDDPWVVQLDDFLTDGELKAFMQHTGKDMKESMDAGAVGPTGKLEHVRSSARTSWNLSLIHI
eukprot:TRINITY_DN4087_c0_g1_i3.p1 TRINITY_DN4087_c0_g1~~TRINITY_DN4087_c0_g1_i3.p1  ORF type:complete len:319 (-),score=46.78 TRINITY_DN4087_c0_g1_i3:147-1103(-)